MEIEVNLTGSSYTTRSLPLSAQVTRNFYPEIQQNPSTRSPAALHSWPGLKLFGSATGADRGMYNHNGTLYRVVGNTLYSVNSAGTHTSLGTIAGTGRCVLAGIGTSLVVVASGTVYEYDGSLTQITDSDLESPDSCAHLNNQMIYDGDGSRFCSSDVGDAAIIDGLNYAAAESDADDLKRVYSFNQLIFLFGERTTETWYNSGVGSPPFDRIEGGIIPVGIGGIYSPSHNDNYIYWLADDGRIYRTTGQTSEAVSTIAISNAIEGYDTITDAVGNCLTFEGQNFYLLTFPTEDKTWCFAEQSNQWFEVSSGVDGGQYRGSSIVYCYRKNLVADATTGDLYELDINTYDDNGDAFIRARDTGPFHSGMIGMPGKRVEFNRFELVMETGVGLLSGQGSEPKVMLQISDDGGRTWSTEIWADVGAIGEYLWKIEWYALGSAFNRIFRIKISDPVPITIMSAMIDVEVGI